MNLDGLFGLLVLGCGLYCLYGYYQLKFKCEINSTILLSKDVDVRKCKDFRAYCKEAEKPLLLLGTATTLEGVVDLYHTFGGGSDILYLIVLGIFFAALILYALTIRKINQKYFG